MGSSEASRKIERKEEAEGATAELFTKRLTRMCKLNTLVEMRVEMRVGMSVSRDFHRLV